MVKLKHKIRFKRLTAPKRLQIMGLTIIVLAGGIATYFTTYISRQNEYFTNRNFRELASFSDQISSRIENLGDAFKNAVSKTVKERAVVKNQKAAVANANNCSKVPENKPLKEVFEDSLVILAETKFSNIKVSEKLPNFVDSDQLNASLDDLKVAINIKQEQGESWLELVCQNSNSQMPALSFSARLSFTNLINPIIGERKPETPIGNEHEEGFDDVLIARGDDKGDIIYDRRTPELDIVSLRDISFFETPDKKLDFKTLTTTTSSADIHLAGGDYKFYLQPVSIPLPPIRPSQNSNGQVSPNNQSDSNSEVSHWVVCGLINASHFRHETWAVSYTVVVFLAFLCALVALSWPLLKLFFIGPKDRLRLADVYLLGLSFLLGSALLTLFLLWGYTYAAHQNELDHKLHKLAENISGQFVSEVGQVITELETVDAQLKKEVAPDKKAQAPKQPTPLVCYSRTSILDPPTESQETKSSLRDDSYPFFNAFIWMNSGGDQQVLWTIGRKLANLHNVNDRPYFQDIVNGRFFALRIKKNEEEKHFVLQSVASRATGQKTVVISMVSDFQETWLKANPPARTSKNAAAKSESQESEAAEANGVVAMDTNLMSVMRPVMPQGFGYRIIDERGTVLFQSAESKDWAEDFFEECDNNPVLRSLVSERLDGDLDINYAGRGHHLYVKPLANFPNWTLIVFRNKQPLRALYLEIVTLAAFLFFGYALILFLIFCIVYVVRVNSRARAEWIWPASSFTTVYSEFMLVNILWGLLIIAELVFLDGLWLVLLVFLTSLLGIANIVFRPKFAILRKFVERLNLPERVDYSHAYTLNMVMVLIIAGMLPALAFFKVTYNKGMRLFTLQEQRSIWKSYEERNARITSRYSTNREKGSPGPFRNETFAGTFIAHRMDETRDIYEDFYDTSHRKVDPAPDENTGRVCLPTTNSSDGPSTLGVVRTGSGLENFRLGIRGRMEGLLRQLPFFNAFVESDIIAPSHAADCSWVGESWVDPSKGLMHTLKIPGKSNGKSLLIDTKLRTFQSLSSSPTLDFILALLAFLSIPLSLFFLSRFAVRRVFLLDLDRRSLAPIPQNGFVTTSQNLFVIVSSPLLEKDSPPCNGDFYPIDLKKDPPTEGWAAALEAKLKSEELPKKFVLDHFDCHLGDLDRSFQKLELVEQLLVAGKIVVIMSNVDPSAYSAPELFKGKEQNDEAKALEFADRWANVAARFLRVYLVESGNVKFFQETLSQRETSLITAARSETQRDKVGELIELVREECSPRGCLQKIGLEIVKQPEFENMASVEIFKQIAGQARLYYQRIWASCTEGEKLTLVHLAEDRFLSRSDPQLALLLRKGLIVKAPDLRLMNQTFKHFILTRCSHEGLASIEDEAMKTSTWHSLRIPLLTGFVGVILFLVITQKDFYSSSLTIITGLTTGIPALFKVLSLLKTDGGGQNVLSSAANQLTK